MSDNELHELESVVRAVVMRVLASREAGNQEPKTVLSAQPAAKLLVGVCCGECLNDDAKSVLEDLRRANFLLVQPEENAFQKKADREKLVVDCDGVLLPSLGDDDAAKMALGIFDEPVARLALTALASDKPVFAAIHSPYQTAIQKRAPQLARVWDGHRRLLQSYGIEVWEHSQLSPHIRARFEQQASTPLAMSTPFAAKNGKRALVSVKEIEAAAKNGASLKLPPGAIVTPLARDRAKELNVVLK